MRSEAEVAAMNCPVCRVPLSMSERQGIEIDYCPQCRGIWLDRGELDKILERAAADQAPAYRAAGRATARDRYDRPDDRPRPERDYDPRRRYDHDDDDDDRRYHDDRYRYDRDYDPRRRRRRSFLDDLFDFD
jgi:Zn-finger nucleic acid-binding protein